MGLAVTTVASGGLPVGELTSGGIAVTEVANGIAVTKVTGGKPGLGVTFVSATGGPAVTYATWNPADKSAGIVLSGGNLTATTTSFDGVRGVKGYGSGKYYFEYKVTSAWGSSSTGVGLCLASHSLPQTYSAPAGTAMVFGSGSLFVNGATPGPNLGIRAANDVIGIAVDITSGLLWFRVSPSGQWNGSGTPNPATGTGGFSLSGMPGTLYPLFGAQVAHTAVANFGASAFSGAVPSGFTSGWPL